MVPKTEKSSVPTRFTLMGKLKTSRIMQDGSDILVTQHLADGAQLEQRFSQRRAVGKQPASTQMIPAHTALEAVKAEQAKVDAVSAMANRFIDEGRRDLEAAQSNTRRAKEKLAAARTKALATSRKGNAAPKSSGQGPAATTQQGGASSSSGRPPATKSARPARIQRPRLRPGGYQE
jgi:hypothetical protein